MKFRTHNKGSDWNARLDDDMALTKIPHIHDPRTRKGANNESQLLIDEEKNSYYSEHNEKNEIENPVSGISTYDYEQELFNAIQNDTSDEELVPERAKEAVEYNKGKKKNIQENVMRESLDTSVDARHGKERHGNFRNSNRAERQYTKRALQENLRAA